MYSLLILICTGACTTWIRAAHGPESIELTERCSQYQGNGWQGPLFPPSSLRSHSPSSWVLCRCPVVLPRRPGLYAALPKVSHQSVTVCWSLFSLQPFPWNSLELPLHLYLNTQHDTLYFFALALALAHLLLATWIKTASQSRNKLQKERSWQIKNHQWEKHSTEDSTVEHPLGKTSCRVLHCCSLVERGDYSLSY